MNTPEQMAELAAMYQMLGNLEEAELWNARSANYAAFARVTGWKIDTRVSLVPRDWKLNVVEGASTRLVFDHLMKVKHAEHGQGLLAQPYTDEHSLAVGLDAALSGSGLTYAMLGDAPHSPQGCVAAVVFRPVVRLQPVVHLVRPTYCARHLHG